MFVGIKHLKYKTAFQIHDILWILAGVTLLFIKNRLYSTLIGM